MLRHTSEIEGYSIGATDGPIGAIKDYLFDDATWLVRWLVVDAGELMSGRRVLLPPSVLGHVNPIGHQFAVRLTRDEVRHSPDIKTDQPVSRVMESNLYNYYGWSPYWTAGFNMGGYGYGAGLAPFGPGLPPSEGEDAVVRRAGGDAHLRSVREVIGYNIHARDGEIGHVVDFLIEDEDWSVHYLIVDTHTWWPGKKVLVSPRSISAIDWTLRSVDLDVDRQRVKDSPAYDRSKDIDRAYEHRFHRHYDDLRVAEEV